MLFRSGSATILVDVNDPYDVSIADAGTVAEGNNAIFTVTVTPAVVTGDTVTVDWTTVNGTALAGSDFTADNNTLTFVATESSKNITVVTIDDNDVEIPEVFTVDLSNATTLAVAGIGTGTGSATILVDANDAYDISVADAGTVAEGNNAIFTVTVTPAVEIGRAHV